eukprot:CCRYP_013139-RC/>CCRYP_013139-RC protein AED:0.48 eAED:0.48 QI:0/-1/0/1/-1/0/1/0/6
MAPASG